MQLKGIQMLKLFAVVTGEDLVDGKKNLVVVLDHSLPSTAQLRLLRPCSDAKIRCDLLEFPISKHQAKEVLPFWKTDNLLQLDRQLLHD